MTVVDAESRFHVLAVDDSLIDRKLIEMLLKNSSYQVTTVDSGSKALEVLGLRDDDPDSSDSSSSSSSSSPSSSSPDHHQGSTSLKDIPVVIMSSENVPARINRCLEDGAEEFFLKPVKLADMKKLKSHLLKRKQPTQQQLQVEPEQQLDPQQKPEEAVVVEASTDDGSATDCNGSSKRKAAAMELEQQQEEGRMPPDSTKPRLSSSSSGLAVET
ncbi:hypothetical protein U9M48_016479 [Paspalum notatum var. saurae]|uniref:Response regulatory domain-containing protein n=1 Tax=Paspalum notatum var. saurae TaxID=547442 RepID=A0AAQ3T5G8_PASNO